MPFTAVPLCVHVAACNFLLVVPIVVGTRAVLDETLKAFTLLGSEVAAKAARETFRILTARSDWTKANVEAEAEHSISTMEIAARDAITGLGGDPDGDLWHAVWAEMQRSYRETIAELLRDSYPRATEALQ